MYQTIPEQFHGKIIDFYDQAFNLGRHFENLQTFAFHIRNTGSTPLVLVDYQGKSVSTATIHFGANGNILLNELPDTRVDPWLKVEVEVEGADKKQWEVLYSHLKQGHYLVGRSMPTDLRPTEPLTQDEGGKIEEWVRYYRAMKAGEYHVTWKIVSDKSGFAEKWLTTKNGEID